LLLEGSGLNRKRGTRRSSGIHRPGSLPTSIPDTPPPSSSSVLALTTLKFSHVQSWSAVLLLPP